METIIQICGWVGTAFIVTAYFLVSRKMLDPQRKTYQLMNLLGSAGVFVNVYHQRAWPAVALQVVWSIIAIMSLATILRGKKAKPSSA